MANDKQRPKRYCYDGYWALFAVIMGIINFHSMDRGAIYRGETPGAIMGLICLLTPPTLAAVLAISGIVRGARNLRGNWLEIIAALVSLSLVYFFWYEFRFFIVSRLGSLQFA